MQLAGLLEKGLSKLKSSFDKSQNDKTIFITGCSTGIGRATVYHFAQMGWNVVATMRNTNAAKDLEELKNVIIVPLDVTINSQIESAIQKAIEVFGRIDVLVNNAGYCVFGALEHLSDDTIDKQWAVNVSGLVKTTKAVIPHLKKQGGGKIINISSIAGLSTCNPLASMYSMSKFAVEGFTEGLYYELKPLNIDVHLIEPGSFKTAIATNTVFEYNSEIGGYEKLAEKMKSYFENSDSFERGNPDEIAKAIFSLASGKTNQFRTVIGKDAEQTLAFRQANSIEDYLAKTAAYFQ
jgi:NAD(P)-dependent dehydrogenase (short-subunit alcohol dehydrogenase family)